MAEKKDDLHDELAQWGVSLPPPGPSPELKVPEGYFESVETAVWERLKAEGLRPPSPVRYRWGWWSPATAMRIAAAALAVVVVAWLARSFWLPLGEASDTSDLTAEEINAFLRENPELIRPEELSALLSQDFWESTAAADTTGTWELFLRDLSPEELNNLDL